MFRLGLYIFSGSDVCSSRNQIGLSSQGNRTCVDFVKVFFLSSPKTWACNACLAVLQGSLGKKLLQFYDIQRLVF